MVKKNIHTIIFSAILLLTLLRDSGVIDYNINIDLPIATAIFLGIDAYINKKNRK